MYFNCYMPQGDMFYVNKTKLRLKEQGYTIVGEKLLKRKNGSVYRIEAKIIPKY